MKKRIIIYIGFFILYILLAFPIASLEDFIKNVDLEIVLIFGFGLLNCAFSFLFLKWSKILNIIVAFIISSISILIVNLTWKLNIAPDWDAYGIQTAIFTNALVSIILWEITYQLKKILDK